MSYTNQKWRTWPLPVTLSDPVTVKLPAGLVAVPNKNAGVAEKLVASVLQYSRAVVTSALFMLAVANLMLVTVEFGEPLPKSRLKRMICWSMEPGVTVAVLT